MEGRKIFTIVFLSCNILTALLLVIISAVANWSITECLEPFKNLSARREALFLIFALVMQVLFFTAAKNAQKDFETIFNKER